MMSEDAFDEPMYCYLCRNPIEDGQFHYNDHGVQVCKPCFLESNRCFVCRFPGKAMQEIEGLGWECEFCRGHLIGETSDLEQILSPFTAYLAQFGHKPIPHPNFVWTGREALREMQIDVSVPPEPSIDDFLRYCYPVYHDDGAFHLLRRMTKATFVVYTIVQLAAADLSRRFERRNLRGQNPFLALARGWCHWLGYEAAGRLGYDLEQRQMRKWPELGGQGDFDRFEKMSHFRQPKELATYLKANLGPLARKYPASEADARNVSTGDS